MWDDSISMDWESAQSTGSSNTNISESLTVTDGPNRKFIFIKKRDNSVTFEYKPIQNIYSSSLVYDAGTPVFKKLEPGEWIKLKSAYQYAKTHVRPGEVILKGSLGLEYQSDTIFDSFTINFTSTINRALTTFLDAYRN
jgi:hypothetical protein